MSAPEAEDPKPEEPKPAEDYLAGEEPDESWEEKAKDGEPNGLLAWMARNSVAANFFMLVLLVGGALMLSRVKQEVFPEFDLDMILINVPYPGASPEEVEQGVILAIEESVRGIDGIKEVSSTATEGVGVVTLELLLGANADRVLSDVQAAVDRITSFPADVERPVVARPALRRQVMSLVVYGDRAEGPLRAIAERVRDDLLSDPGITAVELGAVRPLEISVEIPQESLRRYGLTMDEVASAIRAASVDVPAGAIKTRRGEVLLRTTERRDRGHEFEQIVVRSQPDGSEITVGDLGRVIDGFQEVDNEATFNGERAVMVNVFRVGEQTPLAVAGVVHNYIEEHSETLPEGVHLAVWDDRSEMYRDRVDLLARNAMMGLVLVLLSLGLFLEIRLAFWVTMGIPISFIGSFLFLPVTGVSVNMISLFAFILTLGIVVDDAIVVGEAVYKKRTEGMPPMKAAIRGVREVATPVVFSVLTTCVAFAPLLFVPGIMGKFFMMIPIVVILVLLISLAESLLILPAHLAHGDEEEKEVKRGVIGRALAWINGQQQRVSKLIEWLIHKTYAPVLERALEWRYLTGAICVAILVAAIGLVAGGRIGTTFFPKIDSDVVTASLTMPFGTNAADTRVMRDRLYTEADRLIGEMGGESVVRGRFAVLGSQGAMGGGPRGGQGSSGSHLTEVAIFFRPSDERSFTAEEFARRWRERVGELAGAESVTYNYSTGASSGAAIDFELSHNDLATLERAGAELALSLREYAGVRDINDGTEQGKEQLDFTLRPEARSLGITESMLARQVRNAFFGSEAARQQRGRNELRIFVRRPLEERVSMASLESFMLRAPNGGEIALGEAAEVRRGHSYTAIRRLDGRRVVHVTADVERGTDAQRVVNQVMAERMPQLLADYPGLRSDIGGEQARRAETNRALGIGFLFALFVMYSMMAVAFRSYLQPLIIITAIPFGVVGAIAGHMMLGYEMSLMSMMGLVALSGVVVNDSLIMVSAVNAFRRSGMSLYSAVRAGGVRRFRPILLTSITTFLGLAPMITETSMGARFLIPMAISLAFGVLFATFVTLLLVPSLYLILADVRRLYQRLRDFTGIRIPIIDTLLQDEYDGYEKKEEGEDEQGGPPASGADGHGLVADVVPAE